MEHEGMSLRAIAVRAGCGLATVSRALAGDASVRPEMRLRVLAAAAALGQLPPLRPATDPRCRTLAMLFGPAPGRPLVPGTLRADLLAGAAEAATALGFTIQVVHLTEAESGNLRNGQLPASLAGVALRGAMLLGVDAPERVRGLAARLPCVLIGNTLHLHEPWVSLNINQYAATVLMLDHLLELGHRRVGFVRSLEAGDRGAERMGAFVAGLALRGLALRPADLLTVSLVDEWRPVIAAVRRGVSAWIADSQPTGEALTAALIRAGLPVPKRVSVASFRYSARSRPPQLTGVFGPWRALGRAAVQALAAPLPATEPGRRLLLDAALDPGATTGPVRPRP